MNINKGSVFMKILLVILAVIVIAGLQMLIRNNIVPRNLGVKNGLLAPVPKSPNAVSSQSMEGELSLIHI